MLILSGLIASAWILYAIHDQGWRDRVLASNLPRALRVVFFGWPDFYQPIFYPLIAALPFLTIIFLSSLAWHVGQLGHKNITVILRHPIMIILGMFSAIAVVTPIIKPLYEETRYFYSVYPFIILLIVMACYEVLGRTLGRVTGKSNLVVLSGFIAIGLFAISKDFNLHQLLHINSPEITFRTGAFKRYEHLWFWRFDDRSPAEFLNAHRNDVDALVLSSHARTLPYYLQSEVNFAYYYRGRKRTACFASQLPSRVGPVDTECCARSREARTVDWSPASRHGTRALRLHRASPVLVSRPAG